MDVDDLWELVEGSRQHSDDPSERLDWLRRQLVEKPLPEIVSFKVCLDELRRPVDTWEMWAAADQILGGCSDDSFWYFQLWIVGLGREVFERAAADPDSLAQTPELRRLAGRPIAAWSDDEWPEWESLDYVAAEAFEELTGEEDGLDDALAAAGLDLPACPEPTGDPWDVRNAAEAARRLPRLSTLFPLPAGPSWGA
ncbi:DUF4240 domain-containing protein [Kitasatospora sp. MAP5-34]|uniref:DUF4240 domain-containing protein n=1 Tax=Kitasatospora sp. MAP5-34 TaxID=3035102 RepID=UPI0024770880|nr:DUF4240 domain-containing protein [Kitasatospora sp. MAP5-34]MDH6580570.1 hypothetical protein [Kitasatospora sp. MAP5-34]